MEAQIVSWLSGISSTVFRIAATLFVVVNLAAVAAVVTTRSRDLVNRWSSPWLATNLLLLGAGLGVPLLAAMAKVAVRAMAAMGGFVISPDQ